MTAIYGGMSIPTVPAGTLLSNILCRMCGENRNMPPMVNEAERGRGLRGFSWAVLATLLGRGLASRTVKAIVNMTRGTPIRSAVPVNGTIIRRSMAKQRGKNRPVAAPEQADYLIIQAIYR
jgi:hypothetical protein